MGWEKSRRCNLPEAARIPIPNESEVREQTAGHLDALMRHQEQLLSMDVEQIQRLIHLAANSRLKGAAFFAALKSKGKNNKTRSRDTRKNDSPRGRRK